MATAAATMAVAVVARMVAKSRATVSTLAAAAASPALELRQREARVRAEQLLGDLLDPRAR